MNARPVRRRAVLVLAALLTVLSVLVGSAPALAHAELISSEPADGTSVGSLPRAVVLRFSEGVQAPAAVTVVGPSGREVTAGAPVLLGRTLSQKLSRRADGPGGYAVRFQVMSDDGHLVYGATTFTVSGGGATGKAAIFDERSGVSQSAVLLLGLALLATLGLAAAGIGRLMGETPDG